MKSIANVLIAIVVGIHFYFAYVEFSRRNDASFYRELKVDLAEQQSVTEIGKIVANAAVFNALLGVGLIISLVVGGERSRILKIYLLTVVIIAGAVGGWTLVPGVAAAQSVPAVFAVAFVLLASRAT